MMQSIILAGGRGTRISALTGEQSKHLLTIGGETIIMRLLRQLSECGARRHIIAVRSSSGLPEHLDSLLDYGEIIQVETRGHKAWDLVSAAARAVDGGFDVSIILMGDLIIREGQLCAFVKQRIPEEGDLVVSYTEREMASGGVALVDTPHGLQFSRDRTRGPAQISSGCYLANTRCLSSIQEVWTPEITQMFSLMNQAIASGLDTSRRLLSNVYDINTEASLALARQDAG